MGSALSTEKPRQGWGDVSSHLRDFVITTYDVPPDALARYLPDGLEPDVFTLDAGEPRAFVSAVSFLNTRFFVRFAPFVRLTVRQVNYRAYVRRGEERAVWFFGTSLATRLGLIVPRLIWGLPWAYAEGEHDARWTDDEHLEALSWQARGEHGEERLRIEGTGEPMGRLDGFADEEETQLVLTHPLIGYLRRRARAVVTYSVWHAPLQLERAHAHEARFELFERLGLIEENAAPHSVLAQRMTHYLIQLPPRRAALTTHLANTR
jgi:uncharacterized protein YqjF (DUF2071 family)